MRARLLAVILASGMLVAGCAELFAQDPASDQRLGQLLPNGSLVIGAGRLSGLDRFGQHVEIDWLATAYRSGDQACTGWIWNGEEAGGSCSTISSQDGLPDFMLSLGSPAVVEGLLDEAVVTVRVRLAQGEVEPPLVSLEPIGLAGSGFSIVLLDGRQYVSAVGYSATGREVRADP